MYLLLYFFRQAAFPHPGVFSSGSFLQLLMMQRVWGPVRIRSPGLWARVGVPGQLWDTQLSLKG